MYHINDEKCEKVTRTFQALESLAQTKYGKHFSGQWQCKLGVRKVGKCLKTHFSAVFRARVELKGKLIMYDPVNIRRRSEIRA